LKINTSANMCKIVRCHSRTPEQVMRCFDENAQEFTSFVWTSSLICCSMMQGNYCEKAYGNLNQTEKTL